MLKQLAALLLAAGAGAGAHALYVNLHHAPQPRAVAAAPAAVPSSKGVWRSSQGVVLTADDIARIDANAKDAAKHAAELEYFFDHYVPNTIGQPKRGASQKPNRVPVQP